MQFCGALASFNNNLIHEHDSWQSNTFIRLGGIVRQLNSEYSGLGCERSRQIAAIAAWARQQTPPGWNSSYVIWFDGNRNDIPQWTARNTLCLCICIFRHSIEECTFAPHILPQQHYAFTVKQNFSFLSRNVAVVLHWAKCSSSEFSNICDCVIRNWKWMTCRWHDKHAQPCGTFHINTPHESHWRSIARRPSATFRNTLC